MRRRMDNGDEVRPWRWAGPAAEMEERMDGMRELLRTVRTQGFVEGMMVGLAAEGLVVIAAVLWALR